MLRHFLCEADAERTLATLRRLARHNISRWALAGGFAVEIHRLLCGRPPSIRPLNDLDFIAEACDCIADTLADEFLFRHVHPLDPPGKIMLQFVDACTAIRIDLFRAYGAIMGRTLSVNLSIGPVRLISLEDAVARAARLVLDLAGHAPVASKHAHDYLRLVKLVQSSNVEAAWRDHRKPSHQMTFRETSAVVRSLISTHFDLLITPEYSKDIAEVCPSCVPAAPFQLADRNVVLSLLGYC
jgi:hypothetical protein